MSSYFVEPSFLFLLFWKHNMQSALKNIDSSTVPFQNQVQAKILKMSVIGSVI